MSPNIIAVPDVVEAIKGANALVFVLPQYAGVFVFT